MASSSSETLKILVADDEASIRRILATRLGSLGHEVALAENGRRAIELCDSFKPDLVLADVMMPELDGFGLTEQIRAHSDIPIILLSALSDVADRITGLQLGADDYIVKPFSATELEARIRCVMRRVVLADASVARHPGPSGPVRVGDLTFDFNCRQAFRGETRIRLTGMEFALLELLVQRAGTPIPRHELLEVVWGYGHERTQDTRVVDVHVSRLRAKLGDPAANPTLILTARGKGYMFVRLEQTMDAVA